MGVEVIGNEVTNAVRVINGVEVIRGGLKSSRSWEKPAPKHSSGLTGSTVGFNLFFFFCFLK